MTHRPDDSVMFALDELRRLETDRVAAERRERLEAEQAAARARIEEREREEHARRVAEAEARLRVEQELRDRDAQAGRRIEMLRAELDAVRADRERIHATVSRLNDDLDEPSRRRPSGWAFAFGASVLAVAGLVLALVVRPPATHERIVQVPAVTQATQAATEGSDAPADAQDVPDTTSAAPGGDPGAVVGSEPSTEPVQVASAPSPGTSGRHPGGHRPGGTQPTGTDRPGMHGTDSMDSALDFDHCGSDPTCGLELDP